VSLESFIKTAEYFEGRARRARRPDDRERLTVVAKKYRSRVETKDRSCAQIQRWAAMQIDQEKERARGLDGGPATKRRQAETSTSWRVHYFDPRLNRDSVTRPCDSPETALRLACDLMRRACQVNFIQGPENEKIDAVAVVDWCKAHPTRDRRPPLDNDRIARP
jgi:hypothetical protein